MHQIQSQPADAPMPTIAPFVVETKDELADLGASFNSVQNSALDLAAEQAAARRQVSENLVNIARRTQNLLGRSLTSLSDMEHTERDPAMLESLFRLDHLTTRMRRNAESLLVLAGAEQNRMWSAPLPIGDVVRAAVSEIENYGRVSSATSASQRAGCIAPDIAHLLAELLENATMFSPPNDEGDGVRPGLPGRSPDRDRRLRHRHVSRRARSRQRDAAPPRRLRQAVRVACSASRWSPDSRPAWASRCR